MESALRASVGMKDHTPNVSTPDGEGHVHRGLGQFSGGIGVAESEPEDPPGEQVLDRSQVDGTLEGGDLFEITAPFLVRSLGGEIAADQIRRNGSALVRAGQPSPAPFLPCYQPLGAHRPGYGLF